MDLRSVHDVNDVWYISTVYFIKIDEEVDYGYIPGLWVGNPGKPEWCYFFWSNNINYGVLQFCGGGNLRRVNYLRLAGRKVLISWCQ